MTATRHVYALSSSVLFPVSVTLTLQLVRYLHPAGARHVAPGQRVSLRCHHPTVNCRSLLFVHVYNLSFCAA